MRLPPARACQRVWCPAAWVPDRHPTATPRAVTDPQERQARVDAAVAAHIQRRLETISWPQDIEFGQSGGNSFKQAIRAKYHLTLKPLLEQKALEVGAPARASQPQPATRPPFLICHCPHSHRWRARSWRRTRS